MNNETMLSPNNASEFIRNCDHIIAYEPCSCSNDLLLMALSQLQLMSLLIFPILLHWIAATLLGTYV
jgi:hypothetical protein